MNDSRRVGLLGGTFDPVHNAHVALAYAALTGLQLDNVYWVPAGRPWQKEHAITSAPHREAMVRLAMGSEPRFALERIEIEREGNSYTLDTVRELQAREPGVQWFLIIGQDQYAGLHTWGHWQDLLSRVVLAVANRPGVQPAVHADVLQHPHRAVPLPMLDVSSTDIRARVAAELDISSLVPHEVARYIETHGLYRAEPVT
ncbi:MAG: nicotinate-nucleotide adenylyltransferase [Chitinophagaceae bacterium]|nr:nicotinate-nucleotide adenylyltransferase [Rubrivivax sp.]